MKKTVLLFLAPVAFFVLTNASVWEGSGTVAPSGSLPDEGYYAATNSFPRNTVVDITNLENGKSIRVIVASSLDTPGILAVISRDAALSIGLQPRSIGRIRMIQPSDPIAFSRFTEGLSSSGDPDYDPSALLNSEVPPEEAPEIAEESAAEKTTPVESVSGAEEPGAEESAPAVAAGTPSLTEEETEAVDGVPFPAGEDADRNSPAASEIVDVPGTPPGETGEAAEGGSGLFLVSPVPEREEENR
ncbi:MAG: septal ring lytic transglycosylase RlpA family protein, partial [Treponema sp.]|nr:septal ring lytic transglycosylase RlpA family protein [Treponema sp.]